MATTKTDIEVWKRQLLQSVTMMMQKCNNQPFEQRKRTDEKPRDKSEVVSIRALRRRKNAIGASRVNCSSDGIKIMISHGGSLFSLMSKHTTPHGNCARLRSLIQHI
jgi:hypothetical protein